MCDKSHETSSSISAGSTQLRLKRENILEGSGAERATEEQCGDCCHWIRRRLGASYHGELWLKEGGGVSGSSKAESIEVRGSGAAGRGRGYKRRWRKQ